MTRTLKRGAAMVALAAFMVAARLTAADPPANPQKSPAANDNAPKDAGSKDAASSKDAAGPKTTAPQKGAAPARDTAPSRDAKSDKTPPPRTGSDQREPATQPQRSQNNAPNGGTAAPNARDNIPNARETRPDV